MILEVDLEAEAARALNEGIADDMICCCEPNCPFARCREDCKKEKPLSDLIKRPLRGFIATMVSSIGGGYMKFNHLETPPSNYLENFGNGLFGVAQL